MKAGFFTQLITGDDNKTVDPSWVVAMWAVFVILPMVILMLVSLSVADVVLNKHEASVGALGGGIAAVIGSVGAFIASVALILHQDRTAGGETTTTIDKGKTTIVTLPATPAVAAGVEPLSPSIGPEDVGKSVAIVAPKKRAPSRGNKR